MIRVSFKPKNLQSALPLLMVLVVSMSAKNAEPYGWCPRGVLLKLRTHLLDHVGCMLPKGVYTLQHKYI